MSKFFFFKIAPLCLIIFGVTYASSVLAVGKYRPGETMNPDCHPGDSGCSVDINQGVSIGDTVSSGTAGGLLFLNSDNELSQDRNFFYDAANHSLGVGTKSPQALVHIYASQQSVEGSIGETSYGGNPADVHDATFSGNYSGMLTCTYLLGVFDTAPDNGLETDRFVWGKNGLCGEGGSMEPSVITVGIPQLLDNGVYVTFTTAVGHTPIADFNNPVELYFADAVPGSILPGADPFLITDTENNPLFKVANNGKITIAGVEYTFPATAPERSDSILTSSSSGVLSWTVSTPNLAGSTNVLGTETWLGTSAGGPDASTVHTVFIGTNAGRSATDAQDSVFVGYGAGDAATTAEHSNFIGDNAGIRAVGAKNANFFGAYAGRDSTNSYNSIFIGKNAGDTSPDTWESIFMGTSAGALAERTFGSVMIGRKAGYSAANSTSALFAGDQAGQNAFHSEYAVFLGSLAGSGANDTDGAIFVGNGTGMNADHATYATFVGAGSGYAASNSSTSGFYGYGAGSYASAAIASNFMGYQAGMNAAGASASNFIGQSAGYNAARANASNFIGVSAGYGSADAYMSNFIGTVAGQNAPNATNSNFIGSYAGYEASGASNSIFIGNEAGREDKVVNSQGSNEYSILIGPKTSTGGNSNSIALGSGATNTKEDQMVIGSTQYPIDEVKIYQSGGAECVLDLLGLGCTSDERLKTNIKDIPPGVLTKLRNVRAVTYNWKYFPEAPVNIGFVAQNLEDEFPELVSTNEKGQKSVYYAQMTPVLVQAINELVDQFDGLGAWLGDMNNGIHTLFVEDSICINDQCFYKTDIQDLLQIRDEWRAAHNPGGQSGDSGADNQQPVDTTPTDETSQDQTPSDTQNEITIPAENDTGIVRQEAETQSGEPASLPGE